MHKKEGALENELRLPLDLSNEKTKPNAEKYKEFGNTIIKKR